mmetsp:Transcript_26815/g.30037  ORF Transcript_26815/g.30037 Transcript_26815/m.30037 type:complete len:327 (+) Transcript_26815:49-1029(+)
MATMKILSMLVILVTAQLLLISYDAVDGLSMPPSKTSISSSSISTSNNNNSNSRRQVIGSLLGGGTAALIGATTATTGSIANANTMDTESFLQSGGVAMPMGVSGQAGKQKPETGVLLREGTDISRDSKTGNCLSEILVQKANSKDKEDYMPVVASFSAPWPLATGMVYDVECRSSKTGDAAFLAVTPPIADAGSSTALEDMKDKDLIKSIFGTRGRFSFYGVPSDIKIKKSIMSAEGYKILDVNFSTLSQATQSELPRKAQIIATIPKGSSQMVLLIASAPAVRWKNNNADKNVYSTIESFRAVAAPKSNLKIRRKKNTMELDFD